MLFNYKDHADNKFLKDVPKKTLPSWEVRSTEKRVFQNALHTAECLDHICTIVVKIPQLTVMTLVSPPEWILFQNLRKKVGTSIN